LCRGFNLLNICFNSWKYHMNYKQYWYDRIWAIRWSHCCRGWIWISLLIIVRPKRTYCRRCNCLLVFTYHGCKAGKTGNSAPHASVHACTVDSVSTVAANAEAQPITKRKCEPSCDSNVTDGMCDATSAVNLEHASMSSNACQLPKNELVTRMRGSAIRSVRSQWQSQWDRRNFAPLLLPKS